MARSNWQQMDSTWTFIYVHFWFVQASVCMFLIPTRWLKKRWLFASLKMQMIINSLYTRWCSPIWHKIIALMIKPFISINRVLFPWNCPLQACSERQDGSIFRVNDRSSASLVPPVGPNTCRSPATFMIVQIDFQGFSRVSNFLFP